MSSQTVPSDRYRRILKRISASRFLTTSILLHAIFVLLVGGTVLFRQAIDPPDFEAGADGLLAEDSSASEPPGTPETPPMEQFTPQAPTLSAPLSALTTASMQSPTWTVTAVPNAPMPGISESLKGALASLGDRLPQGGGGGGGALGRLGGMRTAMIFGRKVEATKLGVILDVSGSGHPHLAGAVTEIQQAFPDAILLLYPGCGMTDFQGDSGFEIRKYSTITEKDLGASIADHSTPVQIKKALKIPEFEKMTRRPAVKDTLYVAWYVSSTSAGGMIGKTQVAFEDLMKRGVDTIYWFADFADAVDKTALDKVASQLRNRKIKLHVHNFAGKPIKKEVVEMAEKTGGTVNTEKPK